MNIHSAFVDKIKLDFNVNVDLSDVVFTKTNTRKYNENSDNIFGEKQCLIYAAEFTIYNVQFSMKIMAFVYENTNEILKLDIDLHNKHIEKELAACRNFLQRHRNLNATFLTLIQLAKFVETRRLITSIVLVKEPKILLGKNEESGLLIKYLDNMSNVLICICWKIDWSQKDCRVLDVIEVYFNNFVLPNSADVRQKLTALTHPSLDFQTKLKIWKLLMNDLRKNSQHTVQAVITITENRNVAEADSVLVISDNEDERRGQSIACRVKDNKRRRIESEVCSSSIVYLVPD